MMERALKERIIGAGVLVLFVVLVVPVFLDGPPNDAQVVSEPVLLPGQVPGDPPVKYPFGSFTGTAPDIVISQG